jgi:hypothetical protein
MAELTIGLKKKHPAAGSTAEADKRPDIELTEEDLKQIAGGIHIQLRPGDDRFTQQVAGPVSRSGTT